MSTNDGDGGLRRVFLARVLLDESLGTDHIECRYTEEALRVEDTGLFHDLGSNGNGRIHRIRDDQDECLGAVLCDALNERLDNTGIDLEKVITSHTRLALNGRQWPLFDSASTWHTRYSGRDDNDIGSGKSKLQSVILGEVSGDFLQFISLG